MQQPVKKKLFLFCSWVVLSAIAWTFDRPLSIASPKDEPVRQRREIVTIESQFNPDPIILRGKTNGSVAASEITQVKQTVTGPCIGYVRQKPNYILTLSDFFEFLKVQVESQEDTTIIIKGPGGSWCNDDSVDPNPAIAGQWQPGTYKIWIGSYQEETSFPYLLRITRSEF